MQNHWSRALRAAFPHTIPVLTGYLVLGTAYGILMQAKGYGTGWAMAMSAIAFCGSMQFVALTLLTAVFDPIQAFLLSLMVNARHLFYGISMLDKYRGTGWKKFYLIFGMCDESFSINCTVDAPEGVDRGWFMFFITMLNQLYWVCGATMGGVFGSLIHFNTEGLDFVMTAMFVVIFLEQWLKEESHASSLLGLGLSALCLVAFGPDKFMIPAMAAILGVLLLRAPMEKGGAKA